MRKDALNWAVNKANTTEDSNENVGDDAAVCTECGRQSPCNRCFSFMAHQKNILVRKGLVDQSLFDICMPNIQNEIPVPHTSRSLWSTSQHITGVEFCKAYFHYIVHMHFKRIWY